MAFFRTIPKLHTLLELFSREDSWLICINADPDAMASAMALRRIMSRRVKETAIAKVNEITRPDNLAMVRYTHLDMYDLSPELCKNYQKFAMVDSQPHHHPGFANINFSIVIDHHPLPPEPYEAHYQVIRPEYGATSTLLIEHLYNLQLRPGKLLATAMQFGIKTDTSSFERHFNEVDLRAYQHLSRFADHNLLSRIIRSEFHFNWIKDFAKACDNMYSLGSGQLSYVGEVESSDILVNIADFFMRVYEIRWVAVGGVCGDTVVVILRSDGISRDVGVFASALFSEIGSAGGHKTMARAEFPLEECGNRTPEIFVWQRFKNPPKVKAGKQAEPPKPAREFDPKPSQAFLAPDASPALDVDLDETEEVDPAQ